MKRFVALIVAWLLFVLARTIATLFAPVGVLLCLAIRIVRGLKLSDLLLNVAYIDDVLINVSWGDVFNLIFRKMKRGYPYGNPNDSISRVLGKNKQLFTLTQFEEWVAKQLNKIDRDHVEKAAR